ncbi:G-protein coupled receptor Mth2-like, partial [Musca vetustissima]|uniref:G-protein coupled receptor Mth2-like n=1 Tax=Musca vetustissima TaxID=27455 RepID=UPI002AB5E6CB
GIITTLFILITLLVYVLHPKLQNFQSKLLACFLFSLSMGSLTLSIIALPNVVFPHFICGVIGYLGYFFLLVSYCWLNVISFNMLRQLQKSIDHLSDKKRFILYAGYAMGIPLLMVLLLIILEHSNISISFKSGIGGDYCWFSPLNWSALIYWFGIDAILLCLDVSFYLVVILSLKALLKSQPDSKEYLQQLKFAYRYGTLVLVMAISCLIDATANIKSVHQSSDEHSWFYLSSFVSAIQGFVIFLIFGLGPLRQWRHQRFCRRIGYVRDDVQASNFENIEI